jgi:hypothetical protein
MDQVRRLDQLKRLYISGRAAKDDDVASLSCLRKLETLILVKTSIGDAGIIHLRGLTGIKTVCLDENRISENGLVMLKADVTRLILIRKVGFFGETFVARVLGVKFAMRVLLLGFVLGFL